MKTFLLLALAVMHTGCAAVASETQSPVNPSSAPVGATSAVELPRQLADASSAKQTEPGFAVVGGRLMMSELRGASPAVPLWPIAESPISWTRFVSYGERGYAVVLRQRQAILVGSLDADRRPVGELTRIPVRHVIGDPAVATSGDVAFVTWAQGEGTCTSLVGIAFAAGEHPGSVQHISGTECTDERSARTPVLSAAPEGGFVLAFTEIGVWSSQPAAMKIHPAQSTLALEASPIRTASNDPSARLGL
jgi:hypothetical protein